MDDTILKKVKELAGLPVDSTADDIQLNALIESQISDLEFQGIDKRTNTDKDFGLYCDCIARMVMPLVANNFNQSDNYNLLLSKMIDRLVYIDYAKRLKS
jgi:hypothetical protein